MVVLDPLFWLQSMSTLPPRSDFVIRDTTWPGWSFSIRSANSFARSLACSAVRPLTGA
jgi:hypothetical protein